MIFFFKKKFEILFILIQYSRGKGKRAITTETCIKQLTRQKRLPSNNIIDVQSEINPTSLPVQNGSFLHVKDDKHS